MEKNVARTIYISDISGPLKGLQAASNDAREA